MPTTKPALFLPAKPGKLRSFYPGANNQLSIIGFLGRKAETKALTNGTTVVKFSVATKRSWKDNNNEWQEKTQWHQVVFIWNRDHFSSSFFF